MTERRFSDDEVAAIFKRASAAGPTDALARPAGEGVTLAQLQEIAREVGIAPGAVAEAVAQLGQSGAATSRRLLGLPIGVGRTVDLPRAVTDDEWERLLADLRATFDAQGVVQRDGSTRQWTNGNLHVSLEPATSGQRLRLRTVKGSARAAITLGAVLLAYVAFGFVVETARGAPFDLQDAIAPVALAGLGLSAIGLWLARLPSWARTRRAQMDAIATRLLASLPDRPR